MWTNELYELMNFNTHHIISRQIDQNIVQDVNTDPHFLAFGHFIFELFNHHRKQNIS